MVSKIKVLKEPFLLYFIRTAVSLRRLGIQGATQSDSKAAVHMQNFTYHL